MAYIETVDDLVRKWGHSYVLYGDQGVIWIDRIIEDDKIYIETGRNGRWDYEPTLLTPIEIESKFINLYNLDSRKHRVETNVVHLWRRPKRQWKRGICPDNTGITNVAKDLCRLIQCGTEIPPVELNQHVLQTYLKPEYPTRVEDTFKLLPRFIAIALSPQFAIALSPVSPDNFILLSPFGFIGEVTPNGIVVNHEPAWQEVRDYVQRTSQNIPISLKELF